MKSVTLLFKSILPLLLVLITSNASWAQFPNPVCSGNGAGKVYLTDAAGVIWILKTGIPINPPVGGPNPIQTTISLPPGNTGALAVGTNPGVGPNPTYFTTGVLPPTGLTYLQYWNGVNWISTGAVMNVPQIAGSCGAIYGLDTASGGVRRWPGTGTAAPFIGGFLGNLAGVASSDIAGDCNGNFWILSQSGSAPGLRKYNSAGVLQQTFALTGTFVAGGAGLAINGNTIFYDGTDGNFYSGIINTATSTVNFTQATSNTPFIPFPISDFASCGYDGACLGKGAVDSVGACADTARIFLTATGPGPYNWTVLSGGPAFVSGSATTQTVQVTAWGPALIAYKDADCAGVNTIADTTVVFVTKATIAGPADDTIIGCRAFFLDTLHAALIDSTDGVIYAPSWTPLGGEIQSGDQTYDPIITPTYSHYYYLDVQTLNGCKFRDSVYITVADSTPKADFTYIANLGCDEDTVRFINKSPTNPSITTILWYFNDTVNNNGNQITSNAVSPTHIYKDQAIYSVLLTVSNQYCLDTMRQFIDLLHPIIAKFTVDDSACSHELLTFTDGSTGNGLSFDYTFGDGDTSILASPTHTYDYAGTYTAMLAVKDGVGCVDTTYRTIFIDTIPYVRFVAPDSVICEGQALHLIADYLRIGNTGITVDLGDGTVFQNSDTTIYSYAVANSTPYTVTLTAHYRTCRDTVVKLDVLVNPFPGVNIGPDTVLCPNGSAIVLSDRVNIGNPMAKYLWNTGDTTASILAKDIGTYWSRVTIGGCSGTDSILVDKDCYVNIPNSFTPDGDGVNDYFLPRQFLSRSLTAFKMSIFNRWGQIVYESSTLNGSGWDGKFNGKEQPQGVFVYIIDVSFDNGVKEHYTGNVTLLR